jgi:hypothetical protein
MDNEYLRKDVGELYSRMNDGMPSEQLDMVKRAGIALGHHLVLERACELMNRDPTTTELSDTLTNALSTRGTSIEDDGTTVGNLYQRLFGKDYTETPLSFYDGENLLTVPYLKVPEPLKKAAAIVMLMRHGLIDTPVYRQDNTDRTPIPYSMLPDEIKLKAEMITLIQHLDPGDPIISISDEHDNVSMVPLSKLPQELQLRVRSNVVQNIFQSLASSKQS